VVEMLTWDFARIAVGLRASFGGVTFSTSAKSVEVGFRGNGNGIGRILG
jgi:hypothetical protein